MTYTALCRAFSWLLAGGLFFAALPGVASAAPKHAPSAASAKTRVPAKKEGAKKKPKAAAPAHAKPKPNQPAAHKPNKAGGTKPASLKKAPKGARSTKHKETKPAAAKAHDVSAPTRPASLKTPAPKASDAKCTPTEVSFDRGGLEPERVALVDCAGKPYAAATQKLSLLARPWGTPRPKGRNLAARARHVPAIHEGIVLRLDALAKKFPGRTFSIVGGSRSGSQGSTHESGRALDIRIDGASHDKVAAACRALRDTGCGYYPNASFVHVDVRDAGAGGFSWIDAAGPGEPPRYVTSWPPSGSAEKP